MVNGSNAPKTLDALLRGEGLDEASTLDRRELLERGRSMIRNSALLALIAGVATERNIDAREPKDKLKPLSKVEVQNHVDKMIKDGAIVWATVEQVLAGEIPDNRKDDDEPIGTGCSDGRYTRAQFAMFGGSEGLIPTQLAATEVASGKTIASERISDIVAEELDAGAALCLHMDEAHGLEHFMKESGIKTKAEAHATLKKFAAGTLPAEQQASVQKILKQAGCVSCGHFLNMKKNTAKYRGLRPQHVDPVYSAGIDQMAKGKKVQNAVLKGPHMERYRLATVAPVSSIKDEIPGVPGTYNGVSGFHISAAAREAENNEFAGKVKKLTGIDVPVRDLRKALAALTDDHTAVTTTALDADDLPLYIGHADAKKRRIIIEEPPKK